MNLQPVANRVLIQLHFPPKDGIILPESNLSPAVEEKRTKVECLAIGNDVKVCKPKDFLLLHPDAQRNVIPVQKEPSLAIIDAGLILAVVTDDFVFTV